MTPTPKPRLTDAQIAGEPKEWRFESEKDYLIKSELLEARALLRSFEFIPDWPRAKVVEHLAKWDGGHA